MASSTSMGSKSCQGNYGSPSLGPLGFTSSFPRTGSHVDEAFVLSIGDRSYQESYYNQLAPPANGTEHALWICIVLREHHQKTLCIVHNKIRAKVSAFASRRDVVKSSVAGSCLGVLEAAARFFEPLMRWRFSHSLRNHSPLTAHLFRSSTDFRFRADCYRKRQRWKRSNPNSLDFNPHDEKKLRRKYEETENDIFGSQMLPLEVQIRPLKEQQNHLQKLKRKGERILEAVKGLKDFAIENYKPEGCSEIQCLYFIHARAGEHDVYLAGRNETAGGATASEFRSKERCQLNVEFKILYETIFQAITLTAQWTTKYPGAQRSRYLVLTFCAGQPMFVDDRRFSSDARQLLCAVSV
eukprot:753875-Hanusia_phi.AAC.1